MKIFKTVNLNPGVHFSREKDLKAIDENTNKMVESGWKLEHVVAPNDLTGAIIGFFSKDVNPSERENLKNRKLTKKCTRKHFDLKCFFVFVSDSNLSLLIRKNY